MTENKSNARLLTAQEVHENIDDFGVLSLGGAESGIPKDTKFIAKILEPVYEEYVEKLDSNIYKFLVEYSNHDVEPFQFRVRVSEGAVKRMLEKHKDDVYVGKRAFFGKVSWKGRQCHSIGVMLKENPNFKGKPELVMKNQEAPEESSDSSPKEELPKSIQAGSPANKTPDIPEVLKDWAEKTLTTHKEDFINAFCSEDVLKGRAQPTAFIEWMLQPDQCETDYIANIDGDKRMKATSLFWALVAKLEGNQN